MNGGGAPGAAASLRVAFVLEQGMGHGTFARRMRDAVARDAAVDAAWLPISPAIRAPVDRIPLLGRNWSVRGSLRARVALARHAGAPPDAMLVHTQTVSLLLPDVIRRVPTVVSVDATPRNLDELAGGYEHAVGDARTEALKARIVGRPLRAARIVAAWSAWVARSLEHDYGVDPAGIRILPAGVPLPPVGAEAEVRARGDRPLRLLFVGADVARKGGETLLRAVDGAPEVQRLDLVTPEDVGPVPPNVHVHRGLGPGDPALARLFADADAFVFPTRADASPFAVIEALAAGLPVISTAVGAIPDMVGAAGTLVEPDDPRGLREAIASLVPAERRGPLAAAARRRAEDHYDERRTGAAMLAALREVAARP